LLHGFDELVLDLQTTGYSYWQLEKNLLWKGSMNQPDTFLKVVFIGCPMTNEPVQIPPKTQRIMIGIEKVL
jgi:hypothetical protein